MPICGEFLFPAFTNGTGMLIILLLILYGLVLRVVRLVSRHFPRHGLFVDVDDRRININDVTNGSFQIHCPRRASACGRCDPREGSGSAGPGLRRA
jgi:hypothetical protein